MKARHYLTLAFLLTGSSFTLTWALAQDDTQNQSDSVSLTSESMLRERIAEQEHELETLRTRFTDEHPSVRIAERRLAELVAQLPAGEAASRPERVQTVQQQIEILRQDLEDMNAVYTPNHPAVISAKRRLAQLEQQQTAELPTPSKSDSKRTIR